MSSILDEYLRRTPRSAALAAEAARIFPSGVTHDGRFLKPYGVYIARASGSRKWDVDENEYVDYSGGHGALLLGHNRPEVVAAVAEQLAKGTHYGANHELEIRWARRVQSLLPSAERVRFTSSGTEATLLALRLARALTGKTKVLRFAGHFHGWHDQVAVGYSTPTAETPPIGVLGGVAGAVVVAPANDERALATLLDGEQDTAACLVEPTGASWGQVPLRPEFLHTLREETARRGVLLIFDEVISGFRCAPGGAQGVYGIRPDLTTLAKILAGGLPGGAVVGRADAFAALEFESRGGSSREKIAHHGTFNANPLSAAAGIAALDLVATTDACQRANDYAARLRERLQSEIDRRKLGWSVYGTFSGFHIFTNPRGLPISAADIAAGRVESPILKERRPEVIAQLRLAMLNAGVDLFGWPGGVTSSAHTDDDLETTGAAFGSALDSLAQA